VIREGLLERARRDFALCAGRTAAVVTDDNVAPLYLQTLTAS
jgi:3-dehydroquinate synthetase